MDGIFGYTDPNDFFMASHTANVAPNVLQGMSMQDFYNGITVSEDGMVSTGLKAPADFPAWLKPFI